MSGRIITFYSWKGGVGRTMALANVGVQLARRGRRVLLVDWDLEAPGLERYFQSADPLTASLLSVKTACDSSGLMGLLCEAAVQRSPVLNPAAWENRCMAVRLPALPLATRADSPPPRPEPLMLLATGLGSDDYASRLQSFSWTSFFAEADGGRWLEELRTQWRDAFDFVIIDSRTGLTDSGGICTVQLPDTVVFAFTPNAQSTKDGVNFLAGVQSARASFSYERAPLTIIPLLSRWEGDREVDLADAWLRQLETVIAPFVDTWLPSDIPRRRLLERLRVPHVARFSFGEPLPVLTHSLTDPDRPGLAYDLLAEILVGGLSSAGCIIEPHYRPPFDPIKASDAEIEALVGDDKAREAAIEATGKQFGGQSLVQFNLLKRLAEAGERTGRLVVADREMLRALAIVRERGRGDMANSEEFVSALLHQADIRRALGNPAEARLCLGQALEVIRELAVAEPGNDMWQRELSVNLNKLGGELREQGHWAEALAAFREAQTVSQRLAAKDAENHTSQRELSVSLDNVGGILQAQGDLGGALAAFRESQQVKQMLVAADPSNVAWHSEMNISLDNVGGVLRMQGNLSGALKVFRESLEGRQRLATADPGNAIWQQQLSVSLDNVGGILREQGNLDGALTAFRQSQQIREKLAGSDPKNAAWQRDLSLSLDHVSGVLRKKGDLAGALSACRKAKQVRQKLAAADPADARRQLELSESLENLGDVLLEQKKLPEALAEFRESQHLRQRLAAADPKNTVWQSCLGESLSKVGVVLGEMGKWGEALTVYREAQHVRQRLAAADASNTAWQCDLSRSLDDVGDVLRELGEMAKALAAYREAQQVRRRLAAADSRNVEWQRYLGESFNNVIGVLRDQGEMEEALTVYRESQQAAEPLPISLLSPALQRDLSYFLTQLATISEAEGDRQEALALARESLVIDERLAALDPSNTTWRSERDYSRQLVARLQA